MSSLLIPVDYSLSCHNAYRYGLHLAKEFGLDVVLAHYSLGSIDPGQPLVFAGDGSIHGSHIKRLRSFANSSAEGVDYPLLEPPQGVGVTYETETVFSVSAAIISRAAQSDIVGVVMAPRSSKSLLGKWLGSTSTTVSESCSRPVYLIPNNVRFRPFKQIVVANNHVSAVAFPLWQIEGLADLFKARVHFVHVEWPKKYGPLRFVPWQLMEELVDGPSAARYPFDVVNVEKEDITEGLLEYAEGVDADLLVIVNNVRNRWRSLLHASLTQDLALRSEQRPVLVLHTEDEETSSRLLEAEAEKVS